MLKNSSLQLLSESVSGADGQKRVAESAMSAIDDAVRTDRFDIARQLGKLALAAAKKAKDEKLVQRINQRAADFKAAQAAFAEYQQAQQQLKQDPKDGPASTVAGKYLCYIHDDWKNGLPLLAQASDTTLRNLAETELAEPTVGEVQLELAEGWWDLGGSQGDLQKGNLQAHSRIWYEKAVGGLSGLSKTKAEKRLASEATTEAESASSGLPTTDASGKPLPPAVAAQPVVQASRDLD